MCLSPVVISNHRSDYTHKLHRACVAVPCGECEECIALKKTDIGIRAAFESERWFSAVMLCFTYNDQHQPYLVYDNQREFAVYMPHITELVSILRRHYQRRGYGKRPFAYLIGAEYGVDVNYTHRPHYHALFYLPCTIDAREFTELCRNIWQGQKYYTDNYQSYSWQYGNLGFMLPFKSECDICDTLGHAHVMGTTTHDYLVRDLGKSSMYCAKYATKQIGFFHRPLIARIKKDGNLAAYRDFCPRCVKSRGFGINILIDTTFDPVSKTVYSKVLGKTVNVPSSVMEMYMYNRYFDGDFRPVYNYKVKERFDDSGNFLGYYPIKVPKLRKDGQPCLRKYRKRALNFNGLMASLNSLPNIISTYQDKLQTLGYHRFTRELAVWFAVYDMLPLRSIQLFVEMTWNYENTCDFFFKPSNYTRVYKVCKLFHYVNFDSVTPLRIDRDDATKAFFKATELQSLLAPEVSELIERARFDLFSYQRANAMERVKSDELRDNLTALYDTSQLLHV